MGDQSQSSAAVEELKKQGNDVLRQGNLQGAIDKYTEALKLDPDAHVVLSNRSAALLRAGKAAAALEDALRAVQLAPSWAKAYSRAAMAYLELERFDEAEASAKAGLAIDPSNQSLLSLMDNLETQRVARRLRGVWHGLVAQEVGGYTQIFDFLDDKRVKIIVLGTEVEARYELDVKGLPFPYLDMSVPSAPDSPVIRHIYRFSGPDELHLCSPYLRPADERPTDFKGAGFVLMKRGPPVESEEQAAERDAIGRMSESEKVLEFLRQATLGVPQENTQPVDTDSEAVQSSKLAQSVRFQTVYFALAEKFGAQVDQYVKELVIKVRLPHQETPEIAEAVELFRARLEKAGLLEPAVEEPQPQKGAAVASPKPSPMDSILESPEKPRGSAEPAKSTRPQLAPPPPRPAAAHLDSGQGRVLLGLAVGAAVVSVALIWWLGRGSKQE